VIGINPATDSPERAHQLLSMLEEIRTKLDIPTQTLRAGPCHDHTGPDPLWLAGRSGVPVDRRHASRQQKLRQSISLCSPKRARQRLRSNVGPSATT